MKYSIIRWDPILIKPNNFPIPSFTIRADINFLNFIKNKQYITVTIKNTFNAYNNITVQGQFKKSCHILKSITNLSTIYHLYTFIFNDEWYTYPQNLGYIELIH